MVAKIANHFQGIDQQRVLLNGKQQVAGEVEPRFQDLFDGLHELSEAQKTTEQAFADLEQTSNAMPNERRLKDLENKAAYHEVLLTETYRAAQEAGNVPVPDRIKTIERRMESIEHSMALKNVTFADLEEHFCRQEFANYDGTLL